MPALASAALLNGRYHVLRPVGRGGMGEVYEAIDLRLRNTVAVKEMTAAGPEARQAFEREARLLAALRHHALPVVIDYFIDSDVCFLVMQYIEGEDLAARLRRNGPCSQVEAQRWGAAVLNALAYLHGGDSPVIHRDIKPSNIKLTPRGDVVLLDFGLAKGQLDDHTRLAGGEASLYGFTPNYAPPEQMQFQGTDARSDLYALGATLYHLLAGVAPPAAIDRAAAVAAGQPDPLVRLTTPATFSESLAAVLRCAMALDPADRFFTAAEMLQSLQALALGPEMAPNARLSHRAADRPSSRTRRVDAATPSRAELDRVVDLIVQVRFADSPRLGLEDWPTKRKPDRIEQTSEAVQVDHPVEASTGRLLPARLRVKLVAPDFEIRGANDQAIDVPPEEYSQRVAFLITPRRAGYCRVNVEVYAADALYLGTLAVESEIVPDHVGATPLCTADLVLNVTLSDSKTVAPRPSIDAEDQKRRRQEPDRVVIQATKSRSADLPEASLQGRSQDLESTDPRRQLPGRVGRKVAAASTASGAAPPSPLRSSSSKLRAGAMAVSAVAMLVLGIRWRSAVEVNMPSAPVPGAIEKGPAQVGRLTGTQLLTIAPPAGGTVFGNGILCGTQGKQCESQVRFGETISLEAQADKGFTLNTFTGDCTNGGATQMIGARTCGAMFTPTADVVAGPGGGSPGPKRPTVSAGRAVEVAAAPAAAPAAAGGTVGTGTKRGTIDLPVAGENKPTPVDLLPPPPGVTVEQYAKKQIGELLERYRTAYEKRSYEDLRREYPTAEAAFRDQFKALTSLRYAFSGPPKYVQLDPNAGTGLLEVHVQQTAETILGKRPPISLVARISVQKRRADKQWVIASVVHSVIQ